MKLALFSWQFVATSLAEAYLVSPAGTAAPGTTEDCTQWVEYSTGLTCTLLETYFGMTEAEFEEWNPIVTELVDDCELLPGLYYCVQVNFTTISVSSVNPISTTTSIFSSTTVVSATTTTTTTTTTGSSIATPTPIEPGMVDGCTGFHLVVSGDTCADIAADAGISLTDFISWNPDVGSDCSGLWLGYYICIAADSNSSSSSPTTSTTTTPTTTTATTTSISTSTGNGVTTPTPYESDITDDCDEFHLVVSGDTCADIVSDAGITLDDFYSWNPTVGTDCSGLWLGYYVCVGIL
ncbi:hypothetical protein PEBR_22597 [Penicillium brasilianum]|uniref:LysM domain-containing protein n=1 Tax=Penicillium brasilianum TaxID=104259 RepID=A0A1S9RLC0_PENBI|nr:hypothetical protein PEBR_22597 [Penicillium brasilianum]